jgi:two-component system response regulator QseB
MNLLLVENDARLASAVRSWLGRSRIGVDWITDTREIVPTLRAQAFDWLVLGLGLRDSLGEAALQAVRGAGFELPVIVLTACIHASARVRLLDLGADDCLVKPVHLDELAARLRALMRRRSTPVGAEPTLCHGTLCLLTASRTALLDGTYVALTPHEFGVLETLLRNRGRAVTRGDLLSNVRARDDDLTVNSVDVHVHRLRRKLGAGLIFTVRGKGYALGAAP